MNFAFIQLSGVPPHMFNNFEGTLSGEDHGGQMAAARANLGRSVKGRQLKT